MIQLRYEKPQSLKFEPENLQVIPPATTSTAKTLQDLIYDHGYP